MLLTRFNTLSEFTRRVPRLEHDWLTRRFRMFDLLCYPSVVAQRARFRWLVFFDAGTPAEFKEKIDSYAAFTPVYLDGEFSISEIVPAVLASVEAGAGHLITTRLDSDDALAVDYLATVQRQFHHQRREFVNLPAGYEWCDGRFLLRLERSNPFVSLIERIEPGREHELLTVWCTRHDRVSAVAPLRQVVVPPAWLLAIHGDNSVSRSKGVRVPWQPGRDRFAVAAEALDLTETSLELLASVARSLARLAAMPIRKRGQVAERLREALRGRVDR